MKKYILVLTIGLVFVLSANITQAQQQGEIGLGAIINNPTGFSIKGWVTDDIAIDGAVSFNLRDDFSSLYLHSNVLFRSDAVNNTFGVDGSNVDIFYGAGLRFIFSEFNDLGGIRFPGGFTYRIENTPLVTFFEIAPVIEFTPDGALQFDGAVGARFYLN